MKGLGRPALTAFCAVLLMGSASVRAGQNILYYFSDPGDYIGQGAEVTFTGSDGTFGVANTFNNGILATFNAPAFVHNWTLGLTATGGAVLQAGAYENAERWPFQTTGHPGLSFFGDGRGCNTLTGRFVVLEIARDAGGNVSQLAADWEQHCEGGAPALHGQFRFNSDVPLTGRPIHITLETPLNAQHCVEATGPKGGRVTVNALDATDAQGGRALDYRWSTSAGQTAAAATFSFVAALNQGPANPVVTTLTVMDRTNNTQKTVTKAVCVSDTTPPDIVILKPRPGELVHADSLVLEVSIQDAVDKNITQYEIHIGTNFVSGINPQTGRSKQNILRSPKADGTITTTITVRARDASGNVDEDSVTVSELPKK